MSPATIQSDAPLATNPGQTPQAPSADPRQAEGQYRGERVVALGDQRSLIQDAAEELTFQFGEKSEKSLAKRAIRQDALASRRQAEQVPQACDVLEKLGDLNKTTLERVLETLGRMRQADAFALRQEVREQLPEPAHQYAALLALAERLRAEGAPPAQIAAAEQALGELEREQGPAIRAALNVAAVAAEFAGGRPGELQALRATYRDAVLDAGGLAQTFEQLLERHGEAELPRAIQYLLRALAADLAADGSSIDRAKLNAILDDLYRLEVLTGLLEDSARLIERHGAGGGALTGGGLLGEVLKLQGQSWLRPELIAPLPARLGVRDIAGEINFLREFKEFARLIPLKAYADPEQRPRLLDAVQQALDSAIEREDAET